MAHRLFAGRNSLILVRHRGNAETRAPRDVATRYAGTDPARGVSRAPGLQSHTAFTSPLQRPPAGYGPDVGKMAVNSTRCGASRRATVGSRKRRSRRVMRRGFRSSGAPSVQGLPGLLGGTGSVSVKSLHFVAQVRNCGVPFCGSRWCRESQMCGCGLVEGSIRLREGFSRLCKPGRLAKGLASGCNDVPGQTGTRVRWFFRHVAGRPGAAGAPALCLA